MIVICYCDAQQTGLHIGCDTWSVEVNLNLILMYHITFKYLFFFSVYSDLDTLIHLLKGSLGSGILAMPMAFKNAGLTFGVVATFAIGFICTYCVHILVSIMLSSGLKKLAKAKVTVGKRDR